MEWNRVGFALIILLEVFAALAIIVNLALFLWHKRWRSLLDRIRKGLTPFIFANDGDPAVLEKFHWIQCRLILQGSKVFLCALFLRMVAIQRAMYNGEPHSLQPSLDVSNILSAYLCSLTILSQDYLTPKLLNLWFIPMHFTCLLPLLLADVNEVRDVTYIILLPSFMIGLSSKAAWLFVMANVATFATAAYRVAQSDESVTMTDIISYAASCFLVIGGVHAIRMQMMQNVKMGLRLKGRTIDLEAVSALLLGFCDAVVETDDKLHLTEDSRQLSTMLLQGQRGRGDLDGCDLLSFFCIEDREHIRRSLKANNNNRTMALNARMLDSLGNTLRVELLHIQFSNSGGDLCHLVGMREFQDVAAVEDDSCRSPNLLWDQAVQEILRKADTSLMFDASTFDILTVSDGFQLFSQANGQEECFEGFEGLSVFNLCTETGPQSFTCRMQDAVNAFDENASCQDVIFLRKVELFGQEVDLVVSFQQDSVLNTLVGNVVIISDSDLQAEMLLAYQNQAMRRFPSNNSSIGQLATTVPTQSGGLTPSLVMGHTIGGSRSQLHRNQLRGSAVGPRVAL